MPVAEFKKDADDLFNEIFGEVFLFKDKIRQDIEAMNKKKEYDCIVTRGTMFDL
jgi:hypothetical protein